ncbi:MAG: YcxB family protein [Sphingomicrobium sp.]
MSEGDEVELTRPQAFSLTLGDHFAVVIRSWRTLGIYWLLALVTATAIWSLDLFFDDCGCVSLRDFPWRIFLGMGVFFSALFLLITPLISHWRVKRMLKGKPIVMQLLRSGVSTKLPSAEGVSYWSALKRVIRTEDRLLLFVGRCSAFVIARRAFDDLNEFDRWAAIAEERFAEARSSKSGT